ncbi:MAG: hypothetical protein U0872_16105 [Planctomycetaceae bacterium]
MDQSPSQRRSIFTPWRWKKWQFAMVGLIFLMPSGYLLSFAPMVKFNPDRSNCFGFSTVHSWQFYRPANWVIDNTILKSPLMQWANLWGVERQFTHPFRRMSRGKTTPRAAVIRKSATGAPLTITELGT